MKARRFRVSGPYLNSKKFGPRKWYLHFRVPATNPDGSPKIDAKGRQKFERRRPHFKTRQEAEIEAQFIREQYDVAGFSSSLLSRAAVMEYEAAKNIVGDVNLVELARFWRTHHPSKVIYTVGQLVEIFLERLKKRVGDTRHVGDMSARLRGRFVDVFGSRYPESIQRKEIIDFLLSKKIVPKSIALLRDESAQVRTSSGQPQMTAASARSVLNDKQAVCNFFGYLLEREIIKVNPAAGIRRRQLPTILTKEIKFLSLDQAVDYLRTLERYDPDLVAHEIVQLIAGVRADDEMAKFDGSFVKSATREVVIPAHVAKSKRREVINGLETIFWKWWTAYGRTGKLRPKNYGPRWDRIRVLATVTNPQVAAQLATMPLKHLMKLPICAQARADWPWNGRRRTFCTYHVAKYQSADKTALILRHRGAISTLHNSYRGLGVTQQEGRKYFSILPKPVSHPIRPAVIARGIVAQQASKAGPGGVALGHGQPAPPAPGKSRP